MEVMIGLDFQVFDFTWKTVRAVSWARFILIYNKFQEQS